ncbi:MAG: hypothetical protein KJ685_05035 [Nanoarchaeota archaeon]|nr:hypothetical protein [Nanoarchaeota archaeon]MBU2441802.1 hypothetical protein [Nanoarchaeota archaeon]
MKAITIFVLFALSMLMIAGCQMAVYEDNATGETGEFPLEIEEITPVEETQESQEEMMIPEEGIVLEATEGELIVLRPEAIDPDGDVVTYSFTEPFNSNGRWQTADGDAGQYLVTVTASDGKADTSQDILVIVHKGNKAPIIECPEEVIVKEGDTIRLDCNIYDPEGESVIVEYSGFMKTSTHKVGFDEAGKYTVQIKARDKNKETETTVDITVLDVNRAPEIKGVPEQITAMETEIISLSPQVIDPDGDKATVTFSEPFDNKGVWRTKIGDAGTHKASVLVNDGKSTTKMEVVLTITQKNTAPVLEKINSITVEEGDLIEIVVDATDRENDELDVTVSGWLNTLTYQTGYADAGEYTVTVAVSDGYFEDKQTFKITVLDRNRPPIFKVPA